MNIEPIRDAEYYMNQLSVGQKEELQRLADKSEKSKPQDLLIKMIAKRGFEKTLEELSTPQKKVYAKDAESLPETRPLQRKRAMSLPPLNKLTQMTTKERAMEAKTGELWECIDREPNKSQGYLYHFQLKPEYDEIYPPENGKKYLEAFDQKIKEIFPAVEPPPILADVLKLDPSMDGSKVREIILNHFIKKAKDDLDSEWDNFYAIHSTGNEDLHDLQIIFQQFQKSFSKNPFLNLDFEIDQIKTVSEFKTKFLNELEKLLKAQASDPGSFVNQFLETENRHADLNILGYGSYLNEKGNRILVLPDKEALMSNWEILKQEKYPHLPPLEVLSSEGIADDMSFVEAYFTSDVLLSEGKEFVHDHTSHLMPTLSMMMSATAKNLSTAEAYKKIKKGIIKEIMKGYKQIMLVEHKIGGSEKLNITKEQLEKIKVSLGALIDGLNPESIVTSRFDAIGPRMKIQVKRLPDLVWGGYFPDERWSVDFWNRRFNNEKLDIEELKKVWTLIRKFVPDMEDKKPGEIF